MKKLLFLLLTLTVAISASAGIDQARRVRSVLPKAQAKKGVVMQNAKHTDFVTSIAQPATAFRAPAKVDIPEGYCAITLEAHQVWNTDPEDPDYSGYQMLLDADATAYGVEFLEPGVEGSGLFSGSYDAFEYKIPENADGDLETQNIVYDGSVTILVPAGTYDYVMINPTPGQQLWVASQNGNIGGRGDDVTFVAGRTYLFLITLGSNGNDRTDLYETTVPENLTVVPGDVFANVAWDDNDDVAWNLRWRPWTEGGDGVFWDFPTDNLDWLSEWYTLDADGDGNGWSATYLDAEYTNAGWYSESYNSDTYESYDPDNWLISPEVPLEGELSFTLGGVYRWPDHMGVFAVIGWDPETGYAPAESDLIYVGDYYCSDTERETTITADLSQFNGQVGRLVFRHYDSYDCYYLYIDNIQIEGSAAPWVYVNDLDVTNCTIEGLTPNTKYEVQVQADGTLIEGEWTDIVEFTTLDLIPNVYMLGGNVDNWTPTDGVKFNYDMETGLYTLNFTFDGRYDGYNYFGFTKELAENNDDGGWNYIAPFRFGAVSEGDFEVNDGTLNIDISLIPFNEGGQSFKIPAGEYNMILDLENMTLKIEKVEVPPVGLKGDVNDDHVVNITDVTILISAIMSENFDNINFYNSDMNDDEGISITDVTMLINYVMTLE